MPHKVKAAYLCAKCGAFYTVHAPADDGTEACDDCGTNLHLIAQTESGYVTLKQILRALK